MASGDGDKRKVATDALETLGTIIDDKQKRDAIHLAVEPVVAGERLDPGDHVTVKNGIASFCNSGDAEALGIVDPFLTRSVRQGERFWFVMYPRMVHSLRHVWTHPAFPEESVSVASSQPEPISVAEAEAWLRNWCNTNDAPGFEVTMAILRDGRWEDTEGECYGKIDGDMIRIYGMDGHAFIPREFWIRAELYLGKKLPLELTKLDDPNAEESFFTCSC